MLIIKFILCCTVDMYLFTGFLSDFKQVDFQTLFHLTSLLLGSRLLCAQSGDLQREKKKEERIVHLFVFVCACVCVCKHILLLSSASAAVGPVCSRAQTPEESL